MKGLIMTSSIYIFIMSIILGLVYYIKFDNYNFILSRNLKRSIRTTMISNYNSNNDIDTIFNEFIDIYSMNISDELEYNITLSNYKIDPLMLHIKVEANTKSGFEMNFVNEEIMIVGDNYEYK